MNDETRLRPIRRAWLTRQPGQLIGKGHPAGDFLEAYDWTLLEEASGVLRVRAHLPAHVKNPRGQLFGGFTPTYIDLIALLTVRAGESEEVRFRTWLATTNMRVDYFEPIRGTAVRDRQSPDQGARPHPFRRNALLRSRGYAGGVRTHHHA